MLKKVFWTTAPYARTDFFLRCENILAGDATWCANKRGVFSKMIPVPNSRPVFEWGCIKDAWQLHAVSERVFCALLTLDRKRLRERRDRENWRHRHIDRIRTLEIVSRKLYERGSLDGGEHLERAAQRRSVEFEIAILRCEEMIREARERCAN